MRESPSIDVIQLLVGAGAHIRAYDPARPHEASRLLPQVFMEAAIDAVRSADAVVVMTEWKAFEALDLADLADHMADPVMLDMRNLFSERLAVDSGFRRYERVAARAANAHRPTLHRNNRLPARTPGCHAACFKTDDLTLTGEHHEEAGCVARGGPAPDTADTPPPKRIAPLR